MVVTNKLFEAESLDTGYVLSEMTYTENGALTYKSSGTKLLDMFSNMGAMRKQSDKAITDLFVDAFREAGPLAIICAFYLRDVRGGQGERNMFRIILTKLAKMPEAEEFLYNIIPLIPEYGRWDDLFSFKGTKFHTLAMRFYMEQLLDDARKLYALKGKDTSKLSISLAAKWAGSQSGGDLGQKRFNELLKVSGLDARKLRKLLSALRKHLNVVEREMCANNWEDINYQSVPSRAMKIYRKAFAKHDPNGFARYIQAVEDGKLKINSGTLYPYEIVEKLLYAAATDKVLEAQWNALPDYVGEHLNNALAVVDTSGSMMGDPLNVALSLGLYLAERNKGDLWKNKFITFSNKPTFVEIKGRNVFEKLNNMSKADWDQNTDFYKVFKMILDLAVAHELTQEDLPEVIYVISDMEFDAADTGSQWGRAIKKKTNFQAIDELFEQHGYKRPKLVFWNVDARQIQSQVKFDQPGVALFSGLSPSVFTSVLSGDLITPESIMIERLTSERYKPLLEALDLD